MTNLDVKNYLWLDADLPYNSGKGFLVGKYYLLIPLGYLNNVPGARIPELIYPEGINNNSPGRRDVCASTDPQVRG